MGRTHSVLRLSNIAHIHRFHSCLLHPTPLDLSSTQPHWSSTSRLASPSQHRPRFCNAIIAFSCHAICVSTGWWMDIALLSPSKSIGLSWNDNFMAYSAGAGAVNWGTGGTSKHCLYAHITQSQLIDSWLVASADPVLLAVGGYQLLWERLLRLRASLHTHSHIPPITLVLM